ncbi:MAG: flagellar protein FlgN [Novosphingobium sp.]
MTAGADFREPLRQMVAVLQAERQALAGLDLDAIMAAATDKRGLCSRLDTVSAADIDAECRSLLESARRLNEMNRQVRNLIAANVSARLDVLTGRQLTYRAAPSYSYAGVRA